MAPKDKPDELGTLREKHAWLLDRAREYESDTPEREIENGIFAAQKCAEIAATYRKRAHELEFVIAAIEEAEA